MDWTVKNVQDIARSDTEVEFGDNEHFKRRSKADQDNQEAEAEGRSYLDVVETGSIALLKGLERWCQLQHHIDITQSMYDLDNRAALKKLYDITDEKQLQNFQDDQVDFYHMVICS